MEQLSLWTQFIRFVKGSYTERLKVSAGGILMGFIASQHLLFAGWMAHLVGPIWWIAKGVGTVILAFCTSLATSYGAYLIDVHKDNQKKSPESKRKRNAA